MTTSQPWREASTLIIVARSSSVPQIAPSAEDSTIVTSRVVQEVDQSMVDLPRKIRPKNDYRIMMVKRSRSSSFMASAYVFPGGKIELADFSPKWWTVFREVGYEKEALCKDIRSRVSGPRPPILRSPQTLQDHELDCNDRAQLLIPEIALRIAAIRETFEETGVPLFLSSAKSCISNEDMAIWRSKIHRNASAFVDFCLELKQCPDIWSLYEWWNWLTPTSVGHRRFDAMFYVCCLDKQPTVILDNSEVTSLKWCTAGEMLFKRQTEGIFLPPPQVYELSRLENLADFNRIKDFVRKREKSGVEQWMPIMGLFSDATTSLLPGDDLYPNQPDIFGTEALLEFDESLEKSRSKCFRLNRLELTGSGFNLVCNIEPPCGHLLPICEHSLVAPLQSML